MENIRRNVTLVNINPRMEKINEQKYLVVNYMLFTYSSSSHCDRLITFVAFMHFSNVIHIRFATTEWHKVRYWLAVAVASYILSSDTVCRSRFAIWQRGQSFQYPPYVWHNLPIFPITCPIAPLMLLKPLWHEQHLQLTSPLIITSKV